MFDVVAIGGVTRDIFFEIDELKVKKSKNHLDEDLLTIPYGRKIVADSTYYSYGGGAFNVSVALKKLGLKTAAVCSLGKEGTGSLAAKTLQKNGVNVNLITRNAEHHTGLSVLVIGHDGEHTAFLERGANNFLCLPPQNKLKKTKWFYVSSLTGESAHLLPTIFEIAQKYKIRIAFNPGSEQLKLGFEGLEKYLSKTDLLLVNLEEADSLVASMNRRIPTDINDLLEKVGKLGPIISVVTDAGKGSYAVFEDKDFHQSSISVEVADTTGAGDAFGASFLYAIIKGFDIRYGLKIASVNAASVVTKMGATEGLLNYNGIKSSKWL